MSADPRLAHLPPAEHAPVDLRWVVDVVVLDDVERFLAELGRLTCQMELVVGRLAEIIATQGGPTGRDRAMRAWVIRLLAQESERSGRNPRVLDLHEVVTGGLYDLQADLEACLDPAVGAGVLSRRAAGLLLAMVVPAASRALGDGRSPFTWRGLPIWDRDLSRLGVPLLGVRIAGHEPFRLVRAGAFGRNQLPPSQRTIWNLLELARTTSTSGDHGLVVVPHLEMLDEVPEAA